MAIRLYRVNARPTQDLTVLVRSWWHYIAMYLSTNQSFIDFGGGSLGYENRPTELDITTNAGRRAIVTLADDGNYGFIISGTIRGGRQRIPVNSSKDFDIFFLAQGAVEFRVRNGVWNPSQGGTVRVDILPLIY